MQNTFLRRTFLLGVAVTFMGCAKRPLPKPQASDWARRNLEGVSLEAPYAMVSNPEALPGFINIASYKPERTPNALEIRVDVLKQLANVQAPTLEQFAKTVFSFDPNETDPAKKLKLTPVKVGELDGLRNKAKSKANTFVESVVFKKGEYFWLIETYFVDESLSEDAKRVLDSVKVE